MKNKKVLLIVGALLALLLLAGIVGGIYLFMNKDEDSNSKEEEQEQSETVEEGEELPSYVNNVQTISSAEAFPLILEAGINWAADARIVQVQALPYSYEKEDGSTIYYGESAGKYASWNVTFYSPTRSANKIVTWARGEVDATTEELQTNQFTKSFEESRTAYNEIETYADSTIVFLNLLANGGDIDNHYYSFAIGLPDNTNPYSGKNVWEVTERSRTEMDEYGTGLETATYYFDLITGDFLEKVTVE